MNGAVESGVGILGKGAEEWVIMEKASAELRGEEQYKKYCDEI